MLKEKVIDTHWHIEAWENKDGENYIDYLEQYRQEEGLAAVNIAALPSGEERNVSNNIMIAFYKLANSNAFAHGGLIYPFYPAPEKMPEGMDFVTQYKELMEYTAKIEEAFIAYKNSDDFLKMEKPDVTEKEREEIFMFLKGCNLDGEMTEKIANAMIEKLREFKEQNFKN